MLSISPNLMKIHGDGKHLKQNKKKAFNSPFRKRDFGMWPMKNGVKMKKRLKKSKYGCLLAKMAAVFHTVMIFGRAGKLLESFPC